MPAWLNFVEIQAPRNGTTAHTVDPASTGTVIAGTPFTVNAGRFLLIVGEASVTISTPGGFTLPARGSAINFSGLYTMYKATTSGGETFVTTHNNSNRPMSIAFFEFPAGTTWFDAATAVAVSSTGANPTLSGITGSTHTVFGAAGWADSIAGTTMSATWNSPNIEIVDDNADWATNDGHWLGICYQDNYGSGTYTPTPTITTAGVLSSERLTFAVIPPSGASPQNITDGGNIATGEAIGAHTVTPGAVTVTATGIASAEASGVATLSLTVTPPGIATVETIGAHTVTPGPVTVAPTGIASAEAFGTAVIGGGVADAGGIPTGEAIGAHTITAGAVTVSPSGIPSAEAIGLHTISGGAPSGATPRQLPTLNVG